MQKFVVVFCLMVSLSCSSLGWQTSVPAKTGGSTEGLPADAASEHQIMTLFDLLHVRQTMINMMANMKQAVAEGMEQGLRHKVPNPTPEQLKAMHEIADAALDDLPIDEHIKALIPIYQRHFTKSDIDEMIRFYASPVGQKYLQEQPQMMQESMQSSMEIEKKRMDEIMLKIDKKLAELDQDQTTPKKSK